MLKPISRFLVHIEVCRLAGAVFAVIAFMIVSSAQRFPVRLQGPIVFTMSPRVSSTSLASLANLQLLRRLRACPAYVSTGLRGLFGFFFFSSLDDL